MSKKNYSLFILFVLFVIASVIFWFIVGPSKLELEGISGLGSLVRGFGLYLIPPVAGILTFNKKITIAIITAVIFDIFVLMYQVTNGSSSDLVFVTTVRLLLWDFLAILIALALRFAVNKINQFEKME